MRGMERQSLEIVDDARSFCDKCSLISMSVYRHYWPWRDLLTDMTPPLCHHFNGPAMASFVCHFDHARSVSSKSATHALNNREIKMKRVIPSIFRGSMAIEINYSYASHELPLDAARATMIASCGKKCHDEAAICVREYMKVNGGNKATASGGGRGGDAASKWRSRFYWREDEMSAIVIGGSC